jgi:hypothetical protein
LPAVQRHDPPADASHTPEVRRGPQGKENLNGSCENMKQFSPKRQHNPRVLKDSQYILFIRINLSHKQRLAFLKVGYL